MKFPLFRVVRLIFLQFSSIRLVRSICKSAWDLFAKAYIRIYRSIFAPPSILIRIKSCMKKAKRIYFCINKAYVRISNMIAIGCPIVIICLVIIFAENKACCFISFVCFISTSLTTKAYVVLPVTQGGECLEGYRIFLLRKEIFLIDFVSRRFSAREYEKWLSIPNHKAKELHDWKYECAEKRML